MFPIFFGTTNQHYTHFTPPCANTWKSNRESKSSTNDVVCSSTWQKCYLILLQTTRCQDRRGSLFGSLRFRSWSLAQKCFYDLAFFRRRGRAEMRPCALLCHRYQWNYSGNRFGRYMLYINDFSWSSIRLSVLVAPVSRKRSLACLSA